MVRLARCLLAGVVGIALSVGCAKVEETVGPPPRMYPEGTPQENLATNAQFMSAADLAAKADVPIYPGAETPEGTSTVQSSKDGTRYEIVMSTTDIPEKVMKFYESKLQHAELMAAGSTVMGMSPKGHYVSVKTAHVSNRTDINVVVTDESTSGGAPKP